MSYVERIITIIVQVILFLLPFLVPLFSPTFDVGTFLTAISLLFAILAGFFIANATSNYLHLQTQIAEENADLISIFGLIKLIEPDKKEEIAEAIDSYMISQLDYDFLDHAHETHKEIDKIISVVNDIEPQNDRGSELLSNLHNKKSHLLVTNQEVSLSAKRTVTFRHWFVLILLSVLIGLLLLALRGGGLLGNIIIGVLFVGMYEILVLIYEIDSNQFLAKKISYQNPQRVFKSIGRLPYYPITAFTHYKISEPSESYRVGSYKHKNNYFEKLITLVEK